MALPKINPTTTTAWNKLNQYFNTIKDTHLVSLFKENPSRAAEFTIRWEDFYVDYSKNRIDKQALELLLGLTDEVQLKKAIAAYFNGDEINETEKRAVLHTALRAPKNTEVFVQGKNIIPEIHAVKARIKKISEQVINGDYKGYSGEKITHVVNVGIGGSDLGPAMVTEALQYYKNHLNTYFVSNVDGDHVAEILKKVNPKTTLFVIVSKTFTTQETLSNANTIKSWFLQQAPEQAIAKHFIAVSTNVEAVKKFGITEENVFPMWDWVGGRFSLWSAVGLSISLALGYSNFEKLLQGAHKMDLHFRDTPFQDNIPVIMALLSVWYNNFFEAETEAIIPYTQYLNQFATYLQQGIMESNGKYIDRNGKQITYQTGTIIWGEPGTNAQHAFFQLLHQGTKLIPVDFIGFVHSLHGDTEHHNKLISNFIAQTEALMKGKSKDEVSAELNQTKLTKTEKENLLPYKIFEGNKPTTTLFIDKLTPESLGKLIALYEHKIFVQGVLWNIFSYDQFGVELGKQLANTILQEFDHSSKEIHDASTQNLIHHFLKHKK